MASFVLVRENQECIIREMIWQNYTLKEMNKKRISKGFWIWGQFDQQSSIEIDAIKEKSNNNLRGPEFEFHITLSGPLLEVNKDTKKILKQISNEHHTFSIYSEGLDIKDMFFQSLFLKIMKDKKLLTFKKIIDDRLSLKATEYCPHISLFYGNVTKEIKIKVMKELDAPKELTLSSICIVDVDEEINLWKVIECFPLKCKENVL